MPEISLISQHRINCDINKIYKHNAIKIEKITKNNQKVYKYGNIFHNNMLDEKDTQILNLLKDNAKLTSSQISKLTRIPITTIHNRIKKLEKEKIIKNYTLNLNYEKLNKPLKAYILVSVTPLSHKNISQEDIGKKIKSFEDVNSVDIVTGATDLLVQIRAETMKTLNNFITHKLRNIEGIDKTQTMMVLEEL